MQKDDVLGLISDELNCAIDGNELLSDLPMDSLEYMHLVTSLEIESDKTIRSEQISEFTSVNDLVKFFGDRC